MTEPQMLLAAKANGSLALDALVRGHLAAGRPGMAELALSLKPEILAELDQTFRVMKSMALVLGSIRHGG